MKWQARSVVVGSFTTLAALYLGVAMLGASSMPAYQTFLLLQIAWLWAYIAYLERRQ